MFVELFFAVRATRRALAKANAVTEVIDCCVDCLDAAEAVVNQFKPDDIHEIARNAAAYGWEIGVGQPMLEEVSSSFDNPFMRADWKDLVDRNG